MKEYVFSQYFTVPKKSRDDFEAALLQYIPYMLDEFGMYFYKADYLTSVESDYVRLQVNLYLITALRFTHETYANTNKVVRDVVDSCDQIDLYAKGLYNHHDYSSRIYFQQQTFTRKPRFQ